jgi:hypothetical protein
MGRAMAASDVQAGHEILAGALTFREQYSSAPTSEDLSRCWMAAFEDAQPIRRTTAFKGQSNFAGLWWCATNRRHIGFESWLERDHLIRLDFDPGVSGISSQPFRITLAGPLPQTSHVPDYFVRRTDGSVLVVDVRPDRRISEKDQSIFTATAELCATVGWEYQRLGELPGLCRANLRWIAGYRHPRCRHEATSNDALAHLRDTGPASLRDAVRALGDPVLVLPTLYHLLWTQDICTDLEGQRLHLETLIRTAERR